MVTTLLVVLGVFVVPFVLCHYLAKSWRVPDSANGMGIILCALLLSGIVIFASQLPPEEITYTVQEGDTVQSIVEHFREEGIDVGVKALTDENNLQSVADVEVGRELRIPNPKKLEIKRGVDLSGGVILIYEVDEEQTDLADVNMDALVEDLARRINPGGVKEVVIRKYGVRQVEIIIPDVDAVEVERIKRSITQAGFLRFLIVAKRADHTTLFSLAEAQPNARVIRDSNGKSLGEWVRIGRQEDGTSLRVMVNPATNLSRELRPGVVEVLMAHDRFGVEGGDIRSVSPGYDDRMNPAINFSMSSSGARKFGALTGMNVPNAATGRESRLGIIMDNELISAPTIQSRISDRGQITGSFSDEEVAEMVGILRAGQLEAVLKADPITESRIDPLLGEETIEKGAIAIGSSLAAVLVFMAIYYRFAGLVACFALLLNLVLILALMIIIRGAFTLPGLAGLVLTVGMSVDANVLIFERIREELRRGAALRMAIRNGFGRATTTIVDANITTLITAIVLYAIGTDQLRGFAVTLILGILMSMFTAIYCSRVIFDVTERRRWLKKLTMTQLLDEPKLDLIGKRGVAGILSVALIAVGLVGVGMRKRTMLDIDFLGGTSVQAQLLQGMPFGDVMARLEGLERADGIPADVSLTQVSSSEATKDTIWKIDTSLDDNAVLEKELAERFRDEGGTSLLKSHTLEFDPPTLAEATTPLAPKDDVGTTPEGGGTPAVDLPELVAPEIDPELLPGEGDDADDGGDAGTSPDTTDDGTPADGGTDDAASDSDAADGDASDGEGGDASQTSSVTPRTDLPGYDVLAQADTPPPVDDGATDDGATDDGATDDGATDDGATDDGATDDGATDDGATDDGAADDGATDGPQIGEPSTPAIASVSKLTFGQRVTKDTLEGSIRKAADSLPDVAEPGVELTGPEGQADSPEGFAVWNIKANTSPENLAKILEAMKADLAAKPAFRSSSKIGGKVAGNTKNQAVAAILISLVCIVGYLWIRFQRVVFGLSAVVALVHDVAITLGAIAISAYLASSLSFLLIDEFKISLPVVAAFLTIIGYSLNDTIVVFDRIREVKGRSPDITAEMINTSINQTLSRTLLTSATTLIVVLILFIFGGQGIHGFAFALLVGVMVGTYSSIFVASPALLWMSQFKSAPQQKEKGQKATAAAK